MGACVEQVHAALRLVETRRHHPEKSAHQAGCPVHHGGVDHLTPAGAPSLHQGADHAEGQIHATAAEVPHQIQRRHRTGVDPAEVGQHPGQGDVVDVVSGRRGVRAVLAPTGHPSVDQRRVARQAILGSDSQSFGHPGPEALEAEVGALNESQYRLSALRVLQVDRPVDPDYVGTHVG